MLLAQRCGLYKIINRLRLPNFLFSCSLSFYFRLVFDYSKFYLIPAPQAFNNQKFDSAHRSGYMHQLCFQESFYADIGTCSVRSPAQVCSKLRRFYSDHLRQLGKAYKLCVSRF